MVAGSQTMSYQDKYSVLVVSTGYIKTESLEIKIYGKLNDGTRYENNKTVFLSLNRVERVEFDVSSLFEFLVFISWYSRHTSSMHGRTRDSRFHY